MIRAPFTLLLATLLALAGCRSPQAPQGEVHTLTLASDTLIWGLDAVLDGHGAPLALIGVESALPSVLVVAHADASTGRIRIGLISSEGVQGEVARVHVRSPAPVALASFEALSGDAKPLPRVDLQLASLPNETGLRLLGYDLDTVAAHLQRTLGPRSVAP